MKTIFDYAPAYNLTSGLRFDASCPQRPGWQVSLPGYEWAKNVLLNKKS